MERCADRGGRRRIGGRVGWVWGLWVGESLRKKKDGLIAVDEIELIGWDDGMGIYEIKSMMG